MSLLNDESHADHYPWSTGWQPSFLQTCERGHSKLVIPQPACQLTRDAFVSPVTKLTSVQNNTTARLTYRCVSNSQCLLFWAPESWDDLLCDIPWQGITHTDRGQARLEGQPMVNPWGIAVQTWVAMMIALGLPQTAAVAMEVSKWTPETLLRPWESPERQPRHIPSFHIAGLSLEWFGHPSGRF